MSAYVKTKVIRIPFEDTGLVGDLYNFEYNENWGNSVVGKFSPSPTESPFVDFVLEYEHDSDSGEYGKVRDLYPSEVSAWEPIFKKEMPNCDMSKAKLVEFCWYNCCEAPDYYADIASKDSFFKEVFPNEG